MGECHSGRVREWEWGRVTFEHRHEKKVVQHVESEKVTFEHRHENKSCSACRE